MSSWSRRNPSSTTQQQRPRRSPARQLVSYQLVSDLAGIERGRTQAVHHGQNQDDPVRAPPHRCGQDQRHGYRRRHHRRALGVGAHDGFTPADIGPRLSVPAALGGAFDLVGRLTGLGAFPGFPALLASPLPRMWQTGPRPPLGGIDLVRRPRRSRTPRWRAATTARSPPASAPARCRGGAHCGCPVSGTRSRGRQDRRRGSSADISAGVLAYQRLPQAGTGATAYGILKLGGDLGGTYAASTVVTGAGYLSRLDANGRQPSSAMPLVSNPVRSGSVSASLVSDASTTAGNLINLMVTGNPPQWAWPTPPITRS